MNVLVVDDDAVTREILGHALEQEGYDVHKAGDGQEALEAVRRTSCRLVISDWEMPGLNGLDLCRAIRAQEQSAYIYIILLTRHGRAEDVVEGLSAGADDYITKPFDLTELKVRLRAGERILRLESHEVTIFALAKLAESRDPETGAHLERVRSYSRVIAQHLSTLPEHRDQVDEDYVRLIYQTSPLHDIGKVAIPDAVLRKPGPLTDEEMAIMRTHATHGAMTLEAALHQYPHADYLIMARDIAISHHERFDGSGYPRGLVGEHIPLCGRIVALADVYDAVTTRRVYKPAFPHEVARRIIIDESGKHFDPGVVSAFLTHENEFLAIRRRYQTAEERRRAQAA